MSQPRTLIAKLVATPLLLLLPLLPGLGGGKQPAPSPTPTADPTPSPIAPPSGSDTSVSVVDFGANGSDDAEDTSAIQAANDFVSSHGGGTVHFPPGTYLARGIQQDSFVEFAGAGRDLSRITLYVPDGSVPSGPLIQGRTLYSSGGAGIAGTIDRGSRSLTVNDSHLLRPGSVVAVTAAGGGAPDQATTLTMGSFASATTMKVSSVREFAYLSDSRYLLVDDEVIYYNSINRSDASFGGLSRGRWGTSRSFHKAGTVVSQAQSLVAEVVSVTGDQVLLDRPANVSVGGAPVSVGSIRMSIHDLTIDGNQKLGGKWPSQIWPLQYTLARWVTITDSVIRNGDDGGLTLGQGTRDSTIERNVFTDNGEPSAAGSGDIWLFQRAVRNVVRDNQIAGSSNYGIILDDRTQNATVLDGPNDLNQIIGNRISLLWSDAFQVQGLAVFGGAQNVVSRNVVDGGAIGVFTGWFGQGTIPITARSNTFTSNTFRNVNVGISTNATDTTFDGNTITGVPRPCEELVAEGAQRNTWSGNSVDPSVACPDQVAS